MPKSTKFKNNGFYRSTESNDVYMATEASANGVEAHLTRVKSVSERSLGPIGRHTCNPGAYTEVFVAQAADAAPAGAHMAEEEEEG